MPKFPRRPWFPRWSAQLLHPLPERARAADTCSPAEDAALGSTRQEVVARLRAHLAAVVERELHGRLAGQLAIRHAHIRSLNGDRVVLVADNRLAYYLLDLQFRGAVTDALGDILGQPMRVEIGIDAESAGPAAVRNPGPGPRIPGLVPIGQALNEILEGRTPDGSHIKAVAKDAEPAPPDPRWAPRRIDQLLQEGTAAATVWLLPGYIARGAVTSLSGLPKAGKTVWLAHLLRAMSTGDTFCGRAVDKTRVLLITEEPAALWDERRQRLSIGPDVDILMRPFGGRCRDVGTWRRFFHYLGELMRSRGYELIVFDTLPYHWPVRDENSADEVLAALDSLHALTEAGAAPLLIGHIGKSDAGEGRATRGSGALLAFVDIALELRRYDPERPQDRRRTLTAYSRFAETPEQIVVELHPDRGYLALGSKVNARAQDRLVVLAALLPQRKPGVAIEELLTAWPSGVLPKPGKSTLERNLREAVEKRIVRRSGRGTSRAPYRYWSPSGADADSSLVSSPLYPRAEVRRNGPRPATRSKVKINKARGGIR